MAPPAAPLPDDLLIDAADEIAIRQRPREMGAAIVRPARIGPRAHIIEQSLATGRNVRAVLDEIVSEIGVDRLGEAAGLLAHRHIVEHQLPVGFAAAASVRKAADRLFDQAGKGARFGIGRALAAGDGRDIWPHVGHRLDDIPMLHELAVLDAPYVDEDAAGEQFPRCVAQSVE